jgi:ribulose-bisphosphate carboxylase large chain
MTPLIVTYRYTCVPEAAEAFADALLVEQTVETPRTVSGRYPFVQAHLGGEVEAVEAVGDGSFRARLRLPAFTAASDPAQLLSVVFGNASIHPGVTLEAFELPPDLTAGYGPAFGLDGLRSLTGTYDRPLVASALKPAGLTPGELAALAHALALGGADLVKDDHYLAAQPTAPFDARVPAVVGALDAAAQATGHRTRYAPNVSGLPAEVLRQAEAAAHLGADALLVCPALLGLPTMLALRDFGLPLLAHPAFSGTFKAPPELVQGALFRLYGADAVIFAGYGGRFAVPPETCRAIAEAATRPWHAVRPALPVPAGGMTRERAAELVAFYGRDAALLVGGSLLEADDLAAATRALVDAVAAAAAALLDTP